MRLSVAACLNLSFASQSAFLAGKDICKDKDVHLSARFSIFLPHDGLSSVLHVTSDPLNEVIPLFFLRTETPSHGVAASHCLYEYTGDHLYPGDQACGP